MELPPKNNDESSSSADSPAEGSPKKATRKRTSTTRATGTRTRKPKAAAAAAETPVASAAPREERPASTARERARESAREREPELPFTPQPEARREEPQRREEPETRRPEPEAPRQEQSAPPADVPRSFSADPDDHGRQDEGAGASDAQRPQGDNSFGGGHPNQGAPQGGGDNFGGGGDQQGGGYWKQRRRDKRKRGRHGGPWQPGPGGGGGGQHFQPKPPQPPPPNFAPTFGDLPDPARFNDLAALDRTAEEIATGGQPIFIDELYALNHADLLAFARANGVTIEGVPSRLQLLEGVFQKAAEQKRELRDRGWLDLTDRGYGFVVHRAVNYRLYPEDTYVPEALVRRYGLKRGHQIEVRVQSPQGKERCPAAVRIETVMGGAPEEITKLTPFEELVPYYPLQRILLEAPEVQKDVSMRAVDILTPIGFGQRGLIVAPPRTGKTVLLQNIANSISENFPDAILILLLIDERPEEVTDFKRHTKGEVVSSTFDESPESHVHAAEMVGEKARRLVEQGKHVVILLDSITRLARAYNALTGNQGKTMSGGLESNALQKPKRFFGAARNIEGAGSLTIIGTALIDTGSRMDEIIFEEFKGTGNSELHLDRGLVERRIFPAINIDRSGTRKEELIYHPDELQRIHGLRRAMQGLGPIESMEMLITRLKKTKSNAEFLLALGKQ